jgi:hypothetical protein
MRASGRRWGSLCCARLARLSAALSASALFAAGACRPNTVASPAPARTCPGAQPVLVLGTPSGLERCASGIIHRAASVTCPAAPRSRRTAREMASKYIDRRWDDSCALDQDCTEQPYGYCIDFLPGGRDCFYGCVRDSDCEPGEICDCGEPVGVCISASCVTSNDCAAPFACTRFSPQPMCTGARLACQSERDECVTDADCPGRICSWKDGRRVCDELHECVP